MSTGFVDDVAAGRCRVLLVGAQKSDRAVEHLAVLQAAWWLTRVEGHTARADSALFASVAYFTRKTRARFDALTHDALQPRWTQYAPAFGGLARCRETIDLGAHWTGRAAVARATSAAAVGISAAAILTFSYATIGVHDHATERAIRVGRA
jgi:hypothetical protein